MTGKKNAGRTSRGHDLDAATKETIEESLYYRVADLPNLDVDLVFYDTTSLHFEIDDADTVARHGSHAAGRKSYAPPSLQVARRWFR